MEESARIIELHDQNGFASYAERLEHERKLLARYRSLTAAQGRDLARLAIQAIDRGDLDKAETVLLHLACLVPNSLNGLRRELMARNFFYPHEVYLAADEATTRRLLDRAEQDDLNRNHLLCAVAWAGNEVVQRQFAVWRDEPPVWWSSLLVPLETYAQQAGWALTADGGRKNLFFDACYTLARVDDHSVPGDDAPVRVALTQDAQCRWCGRQLTTLFDINTAHAPLNFPPVMDERLRFPMCDRCSSYGIMYFDLAADGSSTWSRNNERPEFINMDEWDRLPENKMRLGVARRSPYEANQFVMEEGMSQIGGHPAWIQDAEYPPCPTCGDLMLFIAQLQTKDLEEFSEGTTYCFLCPDCRITAVNYQQT
jgi:hypothetical protein